MPPSPNTNKSPRPIPVSLVIPVYNESGNIDLLMARLRPVMDEIARTRDVEAVFVNDGSRDDSLQKLLAYHDRDGRIKIVEFNRNYGQHAAVFAGFEYSTGDVVVTLDADLQNPPEEIGRLLEKIDAGHDVVGTRRMQRQDSAFRTFASRLSVKMTRNMTGIDSGDFGCMLRAYRREVVEAMCHSRELSTFIPALAELYAGNSVVIDVRHEERAHGESKYSLWKLVRLQFDLITSFSMAPLRLLMSAGIFVAGVGFLLSIRILVARIFMTTQEYEDWGKGGVFTLFAILYVFVGAQFIAFGVLGEYIGRIYGEVRKRPRFVVKKFHGETLPQRTVFPAASAARAGEILQKTNQTDPTTETPRA
ncbi:MAG: glycosyltransferase [Planctomycetes bacterium]|nr:glycosyltransferase [Planctomycetota bacterium]